MEKSFVFELKRKFIHFLALIFILVYLITKKYYGHQSGLWALTFILISFLTIDFFRVRMKKKIPFFQMFWRDKEKNKLGGNVYFIIGTLVAFAAFDLWIAVVALLMAIFGDMTGALVGVSIGRHKIKSQKNKSWEGTIAEVAVNLILGFLFLGNLIIGIGMALIATLVEVKFEHVDDNLAIPIFAGFVGQVLSWVV